MAASSASIFALVRSARARASATWACHLPRSCCQCDDASSLASSALALKRSAAAAALSRALATSLSSCSLVRSLAAFNVSAAAFALSETFVELCAQIPVSHRSSYVSEGGLSAPLNRQRRGGYSSLSGGTRSTAQDWSAR